MNKYRNKICEYNGIKFSSKLESDYYIHLVEQFGVDNVIIQPRFILQPAVYKGVKHPDNMKAIEYVSDFRIENTVIDIKGSEFMISPLAKLKFKMFKFHYPLLDLVLVKRVKGIWVNF